VLLHRILRRDGGSLMALARGGGCAAGAEAGTADVRGSGGSAAAGWPAASGRPAESPRHNSSAAAPFPEVAPAFGETAVPAGTEASSRPRLERRTPAGAREERGSAGAAGRARDGGASAPAPARPPGREAAAARLGLRLSGPELPSLLAAPSSQERSIASHRIASRRRRHPPLPAGPRRTPPPCLSPSARSPAGGHREAPAPRHPRPARPPPGGWAAGGGAAAPELPEAAETKGASGSAAGLGWMRATMKGCVSASSSAAARELPAAAARRTTL